MPLPLLLQAAGLGLLQLFLNLVLRLAFVLHCSIQHLFGIFAAHLVLLRLSLLLFLLLLFLLFLLLLLLVLLLLVLLVLVVALLILVLLLVLQLALAEDKVIAALVVGRVATKGFLVCLNGRSELLLALQDDAHVVEYHVATPLVVFRLRNLLVEPHSFLGFTLPQESVAQVVVYLRAARILLEALLVLHLCLVIDRVAILAISPADVVAPILRAHSEHKEMGEEEDEKYCAAFHITIS